MLWDREGKCRQERDGRYVKYFIKEQSARGGIMNKPKWLGWYFTVHYKHAFREDFGGEIWY